DLFAIIADAPAGGDGDGLLMGTDTPDRSASSDLRRGSGRRSEFAMMHVHATTAMSLRLTAFNPAERQNDGIHPDYNLPESQADGGRVDSRRCESASATMAIHGQAVPT
ncbi:hypothetical protein, partial [Mesorhizobium sp.]